MIKIAIGLVIGSVIGFIFGFGVHGFLVANDRRKRIFAARQKPADANIIALGKLAHRGYGVLFSDTRKNPLIKKTAQQTITQNKFILRKGKRNRGNVMCNHRD